MFLLSCPFSFQIHFHLPPNCLPPATRMFRDLSGHRLPKGKGYKLCGVVLMASSVCSQPASHLFSSSSLAVCSCLQHAWLSVCLLLEKRKARDRRKPTWLEGSQPIQWHSVGRKRVHGQPSPHPTVPQSHRTSQLCVLYCHGIQHLFIQQAHTHHLREAGSLLSTRGPRMGMKRAKVWCLSLSPLNSSNPPRIPPTLGSPLTTPGPISCLFLPKYRPRALPFMWRFA